MRFVDSRCIHCGATLRVAGDATHVCCQYCNAELHIVHEGDRATTELVRAMHAGLNQKLDILRIQNDLERLDREWSLERQDYTVQEKGGGRSVPTLIGGISMIVFGIIFGGVWITMASGADAPGLPVAFGILFVLIIVASGFNYILKSNSHEVGEARYQSARSRLKAELAAAERASGLVRK